MRVLALDTSTAITSCALLEDGIMVGSYDLNQARNSSESAVPMIEQMLSSLDLKVSDVDLFAVCKGPGSFTGLRIGMTIAKTFAQVNDKPILSVSTLEAMAYGIYSDLPLVPILDARGGRVYAAVYQRSGNTLETLIEPDLMQLDDLVDRLSSCPKYLVIGDAVTALGEAFPQDQALLTQAHVNNGIAKAAAVLAEKRYRAGEREPVYSLVPAYLRKSQAQRDYEKKQKEAGRVIIRMMTVEDIDAVYDIQKESFTIPWTKASLKQDIEQNKLAHYFVLQRDMGEIIGYASLWRVLDEANINNIAVSKKMQDKGYGQMLIRHMIAFARQNQLSKITLEVRRSNYKAIHVYEKFGFERVGVRKNYYTDGNEDAILMDLNLGDDHED